MGKPSILLINNHPDECGNPGQIDGLRLMSRTGEIGDVSVIHAAPRAGEPAEERDRRVVKAIRDSRADVALVFSMKNLVRDLDAAHKAFAGRPIIYWEGDAWGRGKRIPPEMAVWLQISEYVFSVGGPPQVQLMQAHGAGTVHHTIHTYDHVLFALSEQGDWMAPDVDVALIGGNASRIPLFSGLPGSFGRWRLVAAMKRRHRDGFILAGPGWPRRLSVGRVSFGDQDRFMQRARLLVNWDHYPDIAAYTSDRTAICMIAGRPQVSTLHPEMDWLPGQDQGLFLESSVGGVIRRVDQLLDERKDALADLGRAAHHWAKRRVSHREAMRHMLSKAFPDIERPPADPWDKLPGPWTCENKQTESTGL